MTVTDRHNHQRSAACHCCQPCVFVTRNNHRRVCIHSSVGVDGDSGMVVMMALRSLSASHDPAPFPDCTSTISLRRHQKASSHFLLCFFVPSSCFSFYRCSQSVHPSLITLSHCIATLCCASLTAAVAASTSPCIRSACLHSSFHCSLATSIASRDTLGRFLNSLCLACVSVSLAFLFAWKCGACRCETSPPKAQLWFSEIRTSWLLLLLVVEEAGVADAEHVRNYSLQKKQPETHHKQEPHEQH